MCVEGPVATFDLMNDLTLRFSPFSVRVSEDGNVLRRHEAAWLLIALCLHCWLHSLLFKR